MGINFHIPEWVLWVVGVPMGLFIAFTLYLGLAFIWLLYKWK